MKIRISLKTPAIKLWRRIIQVGFLVIFIGINGVGLYMGNIIFAEMSIRHSRLNAHNADRLKQTLEEGKKNRQWQDVSIESRFGYPLKGTFIPNSNPTGKTLIFLHGFTETRLVGLNYRYVYLNAGFNLLLVDSRAHGDSGGDSVTWGVYEKHDLDQWVDWIRQKYPSGIVGVHGISMGAATALLHAGLNEANKRVSFYIADSSYSDFETLLESQIRQHLRLPGNLPPQLLLPYANIVAYINSRFTFYQASPIRTVLNVTTPVLFIHGEADRLVPASMSQELFQATKGHRQIQLFPRADHVSSLYSDRSRYRNVVQDFARSIEQQLSLELCDNDTIIK
jgi:hypothetical protein